MKKLKNIQSQHSSFWLGKSSQELYGASVSGGGSVVKAIKMRSYQRAVSNFVKILTKEEIPVQFAGTESYTMERLLPLVQTFPTRTLMLPQDLHYMRLPTLSLPTLMLLKVPELVDGSLTSLTGWKTDGLMPM